MEKVLSTSGTGNGRTTWKRRQNVPVFVNLSISTGNASGARKKDWGDAFAIVVEVFDQQELGLEQLKHGAGNFVVEFSETPKLLS